MIRGSFNPFRAGGGSGEYVSLGKLLMDSKKCGSFENLIFFTEINSARNTENTSKERAL
jgi:hypothetical protein